MATVNLRKGQRVELAKGINKLRIELTWNASRRAQSWDLDIMAIEVDEDQLIAKDDPRRLVYYNNLQDPENALVHSGDDRTGDGDGEEMKLDLSKVSADVKELIFILNIFESMKNGQNFGEIKGTTLRIFYDNNTIPDLVYNLEEEDSHKTATVLKVCSVYRSGGIWKFKAINEGVTGTLTSVLTNYGLGSNDNSI
jgi:tellurium resistance protein TerD